MPFVYHAYGTAPGSYVLYGFIIPRMVLLLGSAYCTYVQSPKWYCSSVAIQILSEWSRAQVMLLCSSSVAPREFGLSSKQRRDGIRVHEADSSRPKISANSILCQRLTLWSMVTRSEARGTHTWEGLPRAPQGSSRCSSCCGCPSRHSTMCKLVRHRAAAAPETGRPFTAKIKVRS